MSLGQILLKTAACTWFIVFSWEYMNYLKETGNLKKLHSSFYQEILFSSKRAMSFSMRTWQSQCERPGWKNNQSFSYSFLSFIKTYSQSFEEHHTEGYYFLNRQNLKSSLALALLSLKRSILCKTSLFHSKFRFWVAHILLCITVLQQFKKKRNN